VLELRYWSSGLSALETLENAIPDVILMDAVMPGMDGFETRRNLKSDLRFSHLPVIFMKGLSETQHVVEGFRSGGVDYVTKPIIAEEMRSNDQQTSGTNIFKTRS
jgi:CheY-like chemotaxis protein